MILIQVMHALTVFRTEAPNNLKELTSLTQVQSQIDCRRIKMRLALICIALCLLLSLVEANPQRGGGGRRGGGGGRGGGRGRGGGGGRGRRGSKSFFVSKNVI